MGNEIPLETPIQVVCPICEGKPTEHETTLSANRSGNPMWKCSVTDAVVNMRTGQMDPWQFANEHMTIMGQEDDSDPEQPEQEQPVEMNQGDGLDDLFPDDPDDSDDSDDLEGLLDD